MLMFAPLAVKSRNNATGRARADDTQRQARAPVNTGPRAIGNQAALRRMALPARLQPKLMVGHIDDPLEHEADRVAAQVMSMPDARPAVSSAPATTVRRACAQCAAEENDATVRRQAPAAASPAASTSPVAESAAPSLVHRVVGSSGRPLDAATRRFMEPRFGRSFARVQVHDGPEAASSARSIGARAYTIGHHIVFNAGEFAPGTTGGRRLLAHELTHTAQQSETHARRDIVRRESFDLAGSDVKSCQDKVANDVAVCSDKANTACSAGGAMSTIVGGLLLGAAGGALAGPFGALAGGVAGAVVGGIGGALSYGKCMEKANAICRDRGAQATLACGKKFAPKEPAQAPAGPAAINVNDLPDAPIDVNDLPDAPIDVNDLPDKK
jgi:hypothetical protein